MIKILQGTEESLKKLIFSDKYFITDIRTRHNFFLKKEEDSLQNIIQMNLFTKQKQTHQLENELMVTKWGGWNGGIVSS